MKTRTTTEMLTDILTATSSASLKELLCELVVALEAEHNLPDTHDSVIEYLKLVFESYEPRH